jgi:hypothetical protein
MNNLHKYRQFSYIVMASMTITVMLSLITCWNAMLSVNIRNEGWIIAFSMLSFVSGSVLFYLAYKLSDAAALENIRRTAYETGKGEILQEIEKRNQTEKSEQKIEEYDIDKAAGIIFTGLQGKRSEAGLCNKVLSNLANDMGFVQGLIYVKGAGDEHFKVTGEYALTGQKPEPFKTGEGLCGQVAESKAVMTVYDIPENYFNISSGLGESKPRYLLMIPVVHKEECVAVVELAAFKKPDEITGKVLNKVSAELGVRLNKYVTA